MKCKCSQKLKLLLLFKAKLLLDPNGTSSPEPSVEQDHSPELDTTTSAPGDQCTCPPATSPAGPGVPTSPASSSCSAILGLLSVSWVNKCDAHIKLIPFLSTCPELDVCHISDVKVKTTLTSVCRKKPGCTGDPVWRGSTGAAGNGYNITESGASQLSSCKTLVVKCEVELPDVQAQLQVYKAVTGVLCFVFLVLLLIRFTRPTLTALQRRLSDRRQNRWIGPTQSHSVSYHRGKNTVKDDSGEKRFSYPALERLTIRDSRDSSFNF